MVLISVSAKDFIDELNVAMPSITMENNVIHNNEGYGVILVKPNTRVPLDCEGNHNTIAKKRTKFVKPFRIHDKWIFIFCGKLYNLKVCKPMKSVLDLIYCLKYGSTDMFFLIADADL